MPEQSVTPALEVSIQAFQVASRNEIQGAINHYLSELHARLTEGAVPLGKNGKVTVFILGRYRNDRQYIPEYWQQDFEDLLDVKFETINTSKGDEPVYVVLLGI